MNLYKFNKRENKMKLFKIVSELSGESIVEFQNRLSSEVLPTGVSINCDTYILINEEGLNILDDNDESYKIID